MNIYVGNLSREVTEGDLQETFEAFGEVTSAKIITDKYSGQSRGFGFVEMASKTDGESAITGLKDKELKGRTLNVNEARPRPEGRRSGGGGGGASRSGRGHGGGSRGGRRRSW
jgi:RNA recognition motif-containing protein